MTLLVACPTPPESGPGAGGGPGAAGNPNAGGGGNQPAGGGPGGGAGPTDGGGNAPGGQAATPIGNPETGSILVKISGALSGEPDPGQTQEEVKAGNHVTFSGEAICDDCTEALVLRVVPFINPEEAGSSTPPGPFTIKTLSSTGAYDIAVPKSSDAVVLELLADSNKDGKPTTGERLAVLEKAGSLIPDKDASDLMLDASDKPSNMGAGGSPNTPDQSGGGPASTPPNAGNPPTPGEVPTPSDGGPGGAAPPAGGGGPGAAGAPGGGDGPSDGGTNIGPSDGGTNIGPPGPPPEGASQAGPPPDGGK